MSESPEEPKDSLDSDGATSDAASGGRTAEELEAEVARLEQLAAMEKQAQQLQELLDLGGLATGLLSRLDPPQLADLAGPPAVAIESPVGDAVDGFVASEEFRR